MAVSAAGDNELAGGCGVRSQLKNYTSDWLIAALVLFNRTGSSTTCGYPTGGVKLLSAGSRVVFLSLSLSFNLYRWWNVRRAVLISAFLVLFVHNSRRRVRTYPSAPTIKYRSDLGQMASVYRDWLCASVTEINIFETVDKSVVVMRSHLSTSSPARIHRVKYYSKHYGMVLIRKR